MKPSEDALVAAMAKVFAASYSAQVAAQSGFALGKAVEATKSFLSLVHNFDLDVEE